MLLATSSLKVSGNTGSAQAVCRLPFAVRPRLSLPPVRVTPGQRDPSPPCCTVFLQARAQIRNLSTVLSSFKKDNRRSSGSAPVSTPTPLLFAVASVPSGVWISADWALVWIWLGLAHNFDPKSPTFDIEAVPSTTLRVVLVRQPLCISLQHHQNSASLDFVNCDPLEVVPTTTLCVVLLRQPLRTSLQCWKIQTALETAVKCSQNPFVGFFNVVFDFFVFF
ncbi:hypothetical protein DY000_02020038 [Brassica cretica]|uniref:Uncharacterized protein n=1 Tax=Brassica cretica TaxID=69181 RepID=A0ABQ7EJG8_BRACR|nr:hypothetical protein DY000_02020038 [Brassica cretica]